MKELKCPKCGNFIKIDEADYAFMVGQVRNAEFEHELNLRIAELETRYKVEANLAAKNVEQDYVTKLNDKDLIVREMQAEIKNLKHELENTENKKHEEMALALAEKEKTIAQLNSTIEKEEARAKIAVMEEHERLRKEMEKKDVEIARLKSAAELEKVNANARETELKKQHEDELRAKQEMIDYYKDMKMKLSTKMVGETLEAHCATLFNTMLRPIMSSAYFEKDNDASEGSKGDFIFRDFDEGTEYVSIMFEMKNETDTPSTKHKNEEFFKKLDDDRKKKGCEFAVLVSLLEPDSELYNNGIVDVSYKYDKMYVIRPQFFIPIITLLVQMSKKSLEYKKQLVLAQNKEIDVTNFENKLIDFKTTFGKHYNQASKKFNEAIDGIDTTIRKLLKIKEELLSSENYLRLANKDTEELTIRKLTYMNPTMKQKFDAARKARQSDE